jgi:hypothetical protein
MWWTCLPSRHFFRTAKKIKIGGKMFPFRNRNFKEFWLGNMSIKMLRLLTHKPRLLLPFLMVLYDRFYNLTVFYFARYFFFRPTIWILHEFFLEKVYDFLLNTLARSHLQVTLMETLLFNSCLFNVIVSYCTI